MRAAPILLLFCFATAAYARVPGDHDSRLAKTYYQEFCASCHGAEGRGDGPTSSAFKTATLDLTRLAEKGSHSFDTRNVRALIQKHRGESLLSADSDAEEALSVARHRIALIARHLESLQRAP